MRVAAIIAAGGRGKRLGAGMPKQLLVVGGMTVLRRSIELFAGHERIDEIVVVLPGELAADPPERRARRREAAAGRRRAGRAGRTRSGTGSTPSGPRADVVVVHDAARPFASPALVDTHDRRGSGIRRRDGGALRERHDQAACRTAPAGPSWSSARSRASACSWHRRRRRSGREVLAAALAASRDDVAATDEAALAEAAGFPVRIVAGETTNLKITTMADLAAAQAMAGAGGARPARSGWEQATTCTGSSTGGRSSSAASPCRTTRGWPATRTRTSCRTR